MGEDSTFDIVKMGLADELWHLQFRNFYFSISNSIYIYAKESDTFLVNELFQKAMFDSQNLCDIVIPLSCSGLTTFNQVFSFWLSIFLFAIKFICWSSW